MSEENLKSVQKNLMVLLDAKKDALPRDFNQTRFMQNCMVVLQDTKDIQTMDPTSVARTMLKGAFLGLDFFNKECYAIPFGGKMQFIADYKGEKKIVKKYSINPIKDIYAKTVRKGDEFEECVIAGQQTINFKPLKFNDNEIEGVFAVVLFKDGSMQYEVMSVKEIEQTRKNFSKMANGQAWTKSFGEMAKKTVLRRLCKHIEIDFESVEQQKEFYDASDVDLEKGKNQVAKSSLDKVIDVEVEEEKVVENEND